MTEKDLKQEPLEEVPEVLSEEMMSDLISSFDMESFLTDVMLFDYLVKNNGVVVITKEDMDKLEEMRRTRAVEFSSEKNENDELVLIARFVYRGEEDEEDSDN